MRKRYRDDLELEYGYISDFEINRLSNMAVSIQKLAQDLEKWDQDTYNKPKYILNNDIDILERIKTKSQKIVDFTTQLIEELKDLP